MRFGEIRVTVTHPLSLEAIAISTLSWLREARSSLEEACQDNGSVDPDHSDLLCKIDGSMGASFPTNLS